jgi:hypothetical protein
MLSMHLVTATFTTSRLPRTHGMSHMPPITIQTTMEILRLSPVETFGIANLRRVLGVPWPHLCEGKNSMSKQEQPKPDPTLNGSNPHPEQPLPPEDPGASTRKKMTTEW